MGKSASLAYRPVGLLASVAAGAVASAIFKQIWRRVADEDDAPDALQSEYSLWSRDIETDIVDTCRELGITIVPYSPLGRGFLTGAIRRFEDLAEDDFRRRSPRFQGANFSKNLEIVDAVAAMAQEKGCTPAQLALAWVLAQGDDVVPIPGTKRVSRLEENLGALDVALEPGDLDRLGQLSVVGDRAESLAWVSRDTRALDGDSAP